MAFFVVIEGPDTAGKSTQAQLLKEHFDKQNEASVIIHFPNQTSAFGQMIQEMLKGKVKIQSPKEVAAMQLTYMADFLMMQEEIERFLNEGVHVILDRYTYSNYIYSSALVLEHRKDTLKSIREVDEVNHFLSLTITSLPIRKPDKLFILNLPYEEVKRRKADLDVIESNDKLMERICRFYEHQPLEKFRQRFTEESFIFIDAKQSVDVIHEKIKSEVLG